MRCDMQAGHNLSFQHFANHLVRKCHQDRSSVERHDRSGDVFELADVTSLDGDRFPTALMVDGFVPDHTCIAKLAGDRPHETFRTADLRDAGPSRGHGWL